MKLKLTSEQFDKIQNEVIRLEEDLADNGHDMSSWGRIHTKDRIEDLKKILQAEEIEI